MSDEQIRDLLRAVIILLASALLTVAYMVYAGAAQSWKITRLGTGVEVYRGHNQPVSVIIDNQQNRPLHVSVEGYHVTVRRWSIVEMVGRP